MRDLERDFLRLGEGGELKTYDVEVRHKFRLESRLPTEGDIQAGVRDLIDSLGFGGVLTVVATEGGKCND